jgi:hypothetical protein
MSEPERVSHPPPMRALLTTGLQTLAQCLPGLCLVGSKLLPREGTQPRGSIGDQLHRTTQHSGWRGAFPSCRSSCVRAMRPKKLFESVMGARESRHARTVEQTRPITGADLEQVVDGRRQRACFGAMPLHRPEEPVQALLHRCCTALVLILEEVRCTMHPAIGHLHVGPQGRGVIQPPLEDGLQAPQVLGQGPLFSTRARLSAVVRRRVWRMSPEAAKGGRPSSVRALRTALQ